MKYFIVLLYSTVALFLIIFVNIFKGGVQIVTRFIGIVAGVIIIPSFLTTYFPLGHIALTIIILAACVGVTWADKIFSLVMSPWWNTSEEELRKVIKILRSRVKRLTQ